MLTETIFCDTFVNEVFTTFMLSNKSLIFKIIVVNGKR